MNQSKKVPEVLLWYGGGFIADHCYLQVGEKSYPLDDHVFCWDDIVKRELRAKARNILAEYHPDLTLPEDLPFQWNGLMG